MKTYNPEEIRSLFASIYIDADSSPMYIDATDFNTCMEQSSRQCAVSIEKNNEDDNTYATRVKKEIADCLQEQPQSCIIILITNEGNDATRHIELLSQTTCDMNECDVIVGITHNKNYTEEQCKLVLFFAYD